jgi:hypothetical protein
VSPRDVIQQPVTINVRRNCWRRVVGGHRKTSLSSVNQEEGREPSFRVRRRVVRQLERTKMFIPRCMRGGISVNGAYSWTFQPNHCFADDRQEQTCGECPVWVPEFPTVWMSREDHCPREWREGYRVPRRRQRQGPIKGLYGRWEGPLILSACRVRVIFSQTPPIVQRMLFP